MVRGHWITMAGSVFSTTIGTPVSLMSADGFGDSPRAGTVPFGFFDAGLRTMEVFFTVFFVFFMVAP
jgi:hypothetical protein